MRVNQVGYLPGLAKIATVATPADGAARLAARRQGRQDARQRQDAPLRRRQVVGRARAADRLLVVHGRRQGLQAARRQARERCRSTSVPTSTRSSSTTRSRSSTCSAAASTSRCRTPARRPTNAPPATSATRACRARPEAKCNYKLDVSGGWYDAGDHGKYLVNGGFSVWALQNQYEMLTRFGATSGDFGDGKMSIPEGKNGKPDLLDEARFGLDALLRLQVPQGTAQRRHGAPEDARREVVRDPDDAAQGRHQALPAPGQHGGDAEPGRRRRAGGARVAEARPRVFGALPGRRRDRVRRREEEPERARRSRRSRAAASTATATSATSSTGPPPSCSSPPASPNTKTI